MNTTIDNPQERLFNIGWLIGIIDSEGSFILNEKKYIKGNSFLPTIRITNTNLKIIEKCKKILSNLGFTCYFYTRLSKTGKPCFRIEISGLKRVKKFLDANIRYFECRDKQAKKIYEYVNSRLLKQSHSPITEKEKEIVYQLSELNK